MDIDTDQTAAGRRRLRPARLERRPTASVCWWSAHALPASQLLERGVNTSHLAGSARVGSWVAAAHRRRIPCDRPPARGAHPRDREEQRFMKVLKTRQRGLRSAQEVPKPSSVLAPRGWHACLGAGAGQGAPRPGFSHVDTRGKRSDDSLEGPAAEYPLALRSWSKCLSREYHLPAVHHRLHRRGRLS